jgi:serine protease DegQ
MRRSLAVLVCLPMLAGCTALAEEPPDERTRVQEPPVETVNADINALTTQKLPTLGRDSAERRARRLTVRVRNIACDGLATGSGFAIGRDLLVTNRHVLAGAEDLEVNTWDGKTLNVTSANVGALGDLGLVTVAGTLPTRAKFGPEASSGDSVTAVGYPLGGALTLSPGAVLDRVDGARFGVPDEVLRLSVHVVPGNSGGPLLDANGRVVGVVFAREISTGNALAIAIGTLRRLIRSGDLEGIPPCGYE